MTEQPSIASFDCLEFLSNASAPPCGGGAPPSWRDMNPDTPLPGGVRCEEGEGKG